VTLDERAAVVDPSGMEGASSDTGNSAGREFVEAFVARDFERAGAALDPEVDFRALTPSRAWEASGREQVVAEVLESWLEEDDRVEELVALETGDFADRRTLSYSVRGSNGDGPFTFEQQAYFTERDGRIDWIRIVCSGFRPPGV
jgi:hypothetical protein